MVSRPLWWSSWRTAIVEQNDLSKGPFNASFLKLFSLTTDWRTVQVMQFLYHHHTNLYKIWSLHGWQHPTIWAQWLSLCCCSFLSYTCTYLLLPQCLLLQTFPFKCNHSSIEWIITNCTSHYVTQKNLYWPPEEADLFAQNDWGTANGMFLFLSL